MDEKSDEDELHISVCILTIFSQERFAAIKLLDYILDSVVKGILRIDAITWDIADSRHQISGRDDLRNPKRMYYFLFRNLLSYRWRNDAAWNIYADESTKNLGHTYGI